MKNTLKIMLISIGLIGVYIILLLLLNNSSGLTKYNELGDYVGGILNPLFTLLSTAAIIYLTYILSKNEDRKAEKSIETQKRITLNQMRQAALNDLIGKMNLYVYEGEKLAVYDFNGLLHQKVLTNIIDEENEKGKVDQKVTVWLVILLELENFYLLKYLFLDLFDTELFITKYNDLINIVSQLSDEQAEMKFVTSKAIGEYINIQKELVTIIGNYIYTEF